MTDCLPIARMDFAQKRDHLIVCEDRAHREACAFDLWLGWRNEVRTLQDRVEQVRKSAAGSELLAVKVRGLLDRTRGRKTIQRADLDQAWRDAWGEAR